MAASTDSSLRNSFGLLRLRSSKINTGRRVIDSRTLSAMASRPDATGTAGAASARLSPFTSETADATSIHRIVRRTRGARTKVQTVIRALGPQYASSSTPSGEPFGAGVSPINAASVPFAARSLQDAAARSPAMVQRTSRPDTTASSLRTEPCVVRGFYRPPATMLAPSPLRALRCAGLSMIGSPLSSLVPHRSSAGLSPLLRIAKRNPGR